MEKIERRRVAAANFTEYIMIGTNFFRFFSKPYQKVGKRMLPIDFQGVRERSLSLSLSYTHAPSESGSL